MMQELKEPLRKGFQLSIVLLGITGIIVILFSTLAGKSGMDLLRSILDFFFYFTIQSTLLVVVWFTITIVRKTAASAIGSAIELSLVTCSIATGCGYYLLLQDAWNPSGITALGNLLLHAVVPVMVVLDWLLFEAKGSLRVSHIPTVLILPAAHLVLSLFRGLFIPYDYPYAFLDPVQLGTLPYLRNAAGIAVLLLILGSLFYVSSGMMKARMK